MRLFTEKVCIACRADSPGLTAKESADALLQLPEWKIENVNAIDHLTKIYLFKILWLHWNLQKK